VPYYIEASKDNENAVNALINHYLDIKNHHEVVKWLLFAHKYNDNYNNTILANYYVEGTYIEKDINKAIELYKNASNNNYDYATYKLGSLYYYGEEVEKDYKMAFEYFTKSAQNKHKQSMIKLAIMNENGYGCKANSIVAFNLMKEAYEKGSEVAAYNLGIYYKNEGNI
jgi:TPR repeat protein